MAGFRRQFSSRDPAAPVPLEGPRQPGEARARGAVRIPLACRPLPNRPHRPGRQPRVRCDGCNPDGRLVGRCAGALSGRQPRHRRAGLGTRPSSRSPGGLAPSAGSHGRAPETRAPAPGRFVSLGPLLGPQAKRPHLSGFDGTPACPTDFRRRPPSIALRQLVWMGARGMGRPTRHPPVGARPPTPSLAHGGAAAPLPGDARRGRNDPGHPVHRHPSGIHGHARGPRPETRPGRILVGPGRWPAIRTPLDRHLLRANPGCQCAFQRHERRVVHRPGHGLHGVRTCRSRPT